MRTSRLLVLAVCLAGCGSDPCGNPSGPPTLLIGGADQSGTVFESFAPGDSRYLVLGPQGGMHVWLHARISGVCPTSAVLERRVVDEATAELYQFGRGPVDFVLSDDGETYELTRALTMILCPESLNRPVVDHAFRFEAMVIDDAGRRSQMALSFVARCPTGLDCASICNR